MFRKTGQEPERGVAAARGREKDCHESRAPRPALVKKHAAAAAAAVDLCALLRAPAGNFVSVARLSEPTQVANQQNEGR